MKFPLPAPTLPALSLPRQDHEALKSLTDALVDDAMVEYRAFRSPPHNGTVADCCYKFLKKRDGLTSYLDQRLVEREQGGTNPPVPTQAKRANISALRLSTTHVHSVLTVRTIPGSLHDQVYGIHHYSTELMRIKSVYMADRVADGRLLCQLCPPTPKCPFNGLSIKWSVSDFAPTLLRCVVRPRDFVYLEGTGIIEDDGSGERIGYTLLHSLEIPSLPELVAYQIVRATLSICALFRQKARGVVEVYMKGFVDSKGNIHPRVAVPATAEALLSFRKGSYCGQMKKLNWLLKTKHTVMLDRPSGLCFVCQKRVRTASSGENVCRVCMNQVCASCSESHRLAFLSPSRQIVRRNVLFCARCIRVAKLADALEIASEELLEANPLEYFEMSSNDGDSTVSPSRSTLPDTQQEFFGAG